MNRHGWFLFGFGLLALLGASVVCDGCAYAKPACQVIHVADQTCHVLELKDSTGKTQQVPVSASDLEGLARDVSLRNALDAGAPDGR